jgi:hypothetical protein
VMFCHPQQTRHFFLYRVSIGAALPRDLRCPDGGLVVQGRNTLAILDLGFMEAYRRFPCRRDEMIVLIPVGDRTRRRQAELMMQDWERAFEEFEELMMVGASDD